MTLCKWYVCMCAFLVLGACGDNVTKVVSPSRMETSFLLESLPECSTNAVGKISYVAEKGSAYVCGDSGWVPLSAMREKFSCDLEVLEDSSGYKMICNGDSMGVVLNGGDGARGVRGASGENAENGAGCSILEKEDWAYFQVCGADTMFLYKALCGEKPFDPRVNFCVENLVFAKPVFETLVDVRDSATYRMVKIGNQVWMAEDLRLDVPGSSENDIGAIIDSGALDSGALNSYRRSQAWQVRSYADSAGKWILSGGRLYDTGMSDSLRRTLCPAGTHLPDTAEWNGLLRFVAANSQGLDEMALKATYGWLGIEWDGLRSGSQEDKQLWVNRSGGYDLFGFSALPLIILEGNTRGFWDGTVTSYMTNDPEWRFEMIARWTGVRLSSPSYTGEVAFPGFNEFALKDYVRCLKD